MLRPLEVPESGMASSLCQLRYGGKQPTFLSLPDVLNDGWRDACPEIFFPWSRIPFVADTIREIFCGLVFACYKQAELTVLGLEFFIFGCKLWTLNYRTTIFLVSGNFQFIVSPSTLVVQNPQSVAFMYRYVDRNVYRKKY